MCQEFLVLHAIIWYGRVFAEELPLIVFEKLKNYCVFGISIEIKSPLLYYYYILPNVKTRDDLKKLIRMQGL